MTDYYKFVTVILVAFKSNKIIDLCLKSIDSRIEIILVDNSNESFLKNRIEKNFLNVRYIPNSNIGFGAAANLGASYSKNEYLFFLNPDVVLLNDTIEILFQTARKLNNQFALLSPTRNYNKHEVITRVEMSHESPLFLTKENFFEVNGFDENFFLYYEENDLSKRLSSKNKNILIVNNAKFKHEGFQSHDLNINDEILINRHWHYMWSFYYFEKKHNGVLVAIKKTLFIFIRSFLKMILFFYFNKKKYFKYKARFSGLLNSYLNNKSWYRPKIKE